MQKDLLRRLTTGSPNREHTITYVLGTGEVGNEEVVKVPSFQGYKQTYKGFLGSGAQTVQNNSLEQIRKPVLTANSEAKVAPQYTNQIYYLNNNNQPTNKRISNRVQEHIAERGTVDVK